MMTLALVGGTLIDGNGGTPLQDATVLIDGEKITAAGPAAKMPVPAGARVVDTGGKSVMPGLVDAHNHICGEVDSGGPPHRKLPVFGAIRGVAAARKLLEMGFTTCRAMGSANYDNVALKVAIDQGLVPGPRMMTAAYCLRVAGNTREWVPPEIYMPHPGMFTGPWEVRKAVRLQVLNGADFIEAQTAGAVGSNAPTPLEVSEWTLEEMEAAADEAHRYGMRIGGNCYSDTSVEILLRAGFDAIEHGCLITERGIAALVENGAFIVPTLCAYYAYVATDGEKRYPAWRVAKGRLIDAALRKMFPKYIEAGVKVAGGSDGSGPGSGRRPGEGAKELELMVQYGMTPMQAIVANTRMGADVMGLLHQFGTVEPGKLADVIVVDGDPLKDITIFQQREKIRMVIKGGEVFRGDL
jgi:imidazolonepropionase-like amidohydrolase